MKKIKRELNELLVIIIAAFVLALTTSFKSQNLLAKTFLFFVIIIGANLLVKKIIGYFLEIKVRTKFWSWYQYGFRKGEHFKNPTPMLWLPLLLTAITKGFFTWLAILEFDFEAKTERVARRHGLYRYTQVTEWHMAWIAVWGIIANLILAIAFYIIGLEEFAKLSVYYAVWSLIPLSSLDGSKIFFANRYLWATISFITAIFFGWALAIA